MKIKVYSPTGATHTSSPTVLKVSLFQGIKISTRKKSHAQEYTSLKKYIFSDHYETN